MSVRSGEERGVENEGDCDPGITPQHAVNEKAKNEFFGNWRHHYRQHDDHDALLDCLRAVEEIDNFLPARTAAEKSLGQRFGEQNQWGAASNKMTAILSARLRLVLEKPPNESMSIRRSFKNAATKKTINRLKRRFAIRSRLVRCTGDGRPNAAVTFIKRNKTNPVARNASGKPKVFWAGTISGPMTVRL